MTLQCRTCASVIYNKNAINIFESENLEILTNIEMVVGKVLTNNPELPSHACGCCLLDLKRAVFQIKVFRERCSEAQKQLQAKRINLDSNRPENNHKGKDINLNIRDEQLQLEFDACFQEISNLNADVDDIGDLEEDLFGFQEEEPAQEAPIYEDTSDVDTDADVDKLISGAQQEPDFTDEDQESVEEYEKQAVDDSSLNPDTCSNLCDAQDTQKSETLIGEVQDANQNVQEKERKTKPRQKRYASWKNLTEEQVIERKRQQRRRDCICEQCGRHFTDQSNFKLHMIRHTGIKNFECKECSKRFYTEHLVQLHERIVHQGEQPYACKYCDKRFRNSTSRIVHERGHNNVRPYSCQICGKAFTYASGLSRHLLIHNGARPYFCDVCDRNFQRNTHLKAHLRSKQHAAKQQANEHLLPETESESA